MPDYIQTEINKIKKAIKYKKGLIQSLLVALRSDEKSLKALRGIISGPVKRRGRPKNKGTPRK